MMEMVHYVTVTKDGLYHVQNAVMGLMGQHHVHTQEDFERFTVGIPKHLLVMTKASLCTCGLSAGEVRDHEGNVTGPKKRKGR